MDAAVRFVDWIEPLLRRESYLALLVERPEVQNRLLRLLGLARWADALPDAASGVIDELADEELLHQRFDPAEYIRDLEARHARGSAPARPTRNRCSTRCAAPTMPRSSARWCATSRATSPSSRSPTTCPRWPTRRSVHAAVVVAAPEGQAPRGAELRRDRLRQAGRQGARLRQRPRPCLPLRRRRRTLARGLRRVRAQADQLADLAHRAGELFDIDTALRPNGNSGLLVASLASYEKYQAGRGSNTAWTWEHQALTRARYCAGFDGIAPRFEAVRRAVLAAPRDADALRAEVQSMREKVRSAHPVRGGLFDVKHSAGGMMDVEFAVQDLVLAHSAAHPGLMDNVGNIALLQRAEAAGLLPAGVGHAAADAYRELRRAQHRARLDEQPTQVPPESAAAQRDAVLALWQAVFG
jgi:glutamate-ammonia-ligase adenylyltransferase